MMSYFASEKKELLLDDKRLVPALEECGSDKDRELDNANEKVVRLEEEIEKLRASRYDHTARQGMLSATGRYGRN